MLFLGNMRPVASMKINSVFVEESKESNADAEQWLEVSRNVKNGEDLDGFTDDLSKNSSTSPNMA